MKKPASIKGHPIHPMLIALPIGMLVFSVVCDIVFRFINAASWDYVAFYSLGVGILSGIVAAVPGLIDWMAIEDPVAKKVGSFHMISNLLGLALFGTSFSLRWRTVTPSSTAFVFSMVGIIILSVGGWLGGELVYKHRVAVTEQ